MDSNEDSDASGTSTTSFENNQGSIEVKMTQKLIKQNRDRIYDAIFIICLISISIYLIGGDNWGSDIQAFLKIAIFIKVGIIVYLGSINSLATNNTIPSIWCKFMAESFWIWMFYWYWVVTSKFYQSDNDCRTSNLWLWFSHLTLLIEAFINVFLYCFNCRVCCLAGFKYLKKNETEKAYTYLSFKDLLLKVIAFWINPDRYEDSKGWCICFEPFEKDQEIIGFPCNPDHIFHKECIIEWVKNSTVCPVCKVEIKLKDAEDEEDVEDTGDVEDVEEVDLSSTPFIRNTIEKK